MENPIFHYDSESSALHLERNHELYPVLDIVEHPTSDQYWAVRLDGYYHEWVSIPRT